MAYPIVVRLTEEVEGVGGAGTELCIRGPDANISCITWLPAHFSGVILRLLAEGKVEPLSGDPSSVSAQLAAVNAPALSPPSLPRPPERLLRLVPTGAVESPSASPPSSPRR